MLLSDLYFPSIRILFRTSMRCLLLFFLLFLYGFFEGLCFLDSFLLVLWEPGGIGGTEPLHYIIAGLHSCYVYDNRFPNQ